MGFPKDPFSGHALLFLIYTSDLPNVSSMSSLFIFADDKNIHFEAGGDLNILIQTHK